ncbi:hypothetical protein D3C78_1221920 [compost metagenome]
MLGHQDQRIEQVVVRLRRDQAIAGYFRDIRFQRHSLQHHRIEQVRPGNHAVTIAFLRQQAVGLHLAHEARRLTQTGPLRNDHRLTNQAIADSGQHELGHVLALPVLRDDFPLGAQILLEVIGKQWIADHQLQQDIGRQYMADGILDRHEVVNRHAIDRGPATKIIFVLITHENMAGQRPPMLIRLSHIAFRDSPLANDEYALRRLARLDDHLAFLEVGNIEMTVQQGLLSSIQQTERQVIHLERIRHDKRSALIMVPVRQSKRQACPASPSCRQADA